MLNAKEWEALDFCYEDGGCSEEEFSEREYETNGCSNEAESFLDVLLASADNVLWIKKE